MHENRHYVKLEPIRRSPRLLPIAVPSMDALVYLRGCGHMVMGVRLFLIAIALLAVAALTFLLATA